MGHGIARTASRLPDLEVRFVADLRRAAAEDAARLSGAAAGTTLEDFLGDRDADVDVLVESSSSVYAGLEHAVAALRRGVSVVLMNAEADLAFGVFLRELADRHGALASMDAGDQNGVLLRCGESLVDWGVSPCLYGNIKGYLRRDATQESLRLEAEKRNLSLRQCCAYTDGSKLNIEMALVGNAAGARPLQPGMNGASCGHVTEALSAPPAERATPEDPLVDYLLGAEPAGGVYLVGAVEDSYDAEMLRYYKVPCSGSRFLFHRPTHLCHLETPTAIRRVVRERRPIPEGPMRRLLDVFAYAKGPLRAGQELTEALGSDDLYGLVEPAETSDEVGQVPQCLLQALIERDGPLLLRNGLAAGQPLRFDDLDAPWRNADQAIENLVSTALAAS